MSYKPKNKRKITVLAAVLCIVAFTVMLSFARNPVKFGKLIGNFSTFDTSQDFIKFMDVGQGDSALIYSNGYCAVIDMGLPKYANDICFDLADCFINEIDVALISHLHSDHIGGLETVGENYKIKNLIMPDILGDSIDMAKNTQKYLIKNGTKFYTAKQGLNFKIGEFEITVLGLFEDKSNENNRSIFTVAEIDGIKFIFTGDAELKAEKSLLQENLNLDCDVLKVSHHGSNTATSKEFLNKVTPDYAVISVGEGNSYSHPHSTTMNELKKSGAKIYRTDEDGDITFKIDDRKIKVETEE